MPPIWAIQSWVLGDEFLERDVVADLLAEPDDAVAERARDAPPERAFVAAVPVRERAADADLAPPAERVDFAADFAAVLGAAFEVACVLVDERVDPAVARFGAAAAPRLAEVVPVVERAADFAGAFRPLVGSEAPSFLRVAIVIP